MVRRRNTLRQHLARFQRVNHGIDPEAGRGVVGRELLLVAGLDAVERQGIDKPPTASRTGREVR